MRIVIDVRTGLPTSDQPSCVANSMSYRRLAETLRQCGHVRNGEVLTHFVLMDDRIELRFSTKEKA